MVVIEPFGYPPVQRFPLEAIAGDIGAELLPDRLAAVVPSERVVLTDSGVEHRYDALVLAVGGRIRARYEHTITLETSRSSELLRGLIKDVESGYVRRLAFVVPPSMAWPLPVYELALFTAKRASEVHVELAVTLLTAEDAPLGVLGDDVSRGVSELLADRGIEVIASAHCEVPEIGQVEIASGNRWLEVDRVVALPELYGPGVRVCTSCGTDLSQSMSTVRCAVLNVSTPRETRPTTHQARRSRRAAGRRRGAGDRRARRRAGGAGDVSPGGPRHASERRLTALPERYITGGRASNSEITMHPTWSPPDKISAKYLAPYLDDTFGSGPGRPGRIT